MLAILSLKKSRSACRRHHTRPHPRLRFEQRAANRAEIAGALNVLRQRNAAPGAGGRGRRLICSNFYLFISSLILKNNLVPKDPAYFCHIIQVVMSVFPGSGSLAT